MTQYLRIKHLQVHNANALSSYCTIGVPAMTGVCGFMHAMERQLRAAGGKGRFLSVGVVYHHCNLQTHRGEGDYNASIIGTGNPLVPKSKAGAPPDNAERPSFIEEARCHHDLSLLLEIEAFDCDLLEERVPQLLAGRMKFCGGDIALPLPEVEVVSVESEGERIALLRSMMPGWCLVERRDLMERAAAEGFDGIDALLRWLKVTWQWEESDEKGGGWKPHKEDSSEGRKGWIVPIATGFQGISPLGKATNQRDPDTPHRFAEAVVTLGEFLMPYRIEELDTMLWRYEVRPEQNLYLCTQKQPLFPLQGD